MCILLLALGTAPYPVVAFQNRDEFFSRPSLPLCRTDSGVVAPLDALSGGTWFASKNRRFSAVTNVTNVEASTQRDSRPSRGHLPIGFVEHGFEWVRACHLELELLLDDSRLRDFAPFNLVCVELDENANAKAAIFSNDGDNVLETPLPPFGYFCVSNQPYGVRPEWDKVTASHAHPSLDKVSACLNEFQTLVPHRCRPLPELTPAAALVESYLHDVAQFMCRGPRWDKPPKFEDERSRIVNIPFGRWPDYGTRSQTAVFFSPTGDGVMFHREVHPGGDIGDAVWTSLSLKC
jgi:uncharacterized protein with NRDE domain